MDRLPPEPIRVEHVPGRAGALPPGWSVYAITTDERPDRQRHLRAELTRAGIEARVLVTARPDDPDGFRTAGSRGCVESHLLCQRMAREEGVEVCVIAEDDVLLTLGAAQLMRTVSDELTGTDWSVLCLGYLPASPVRSQPVELLTDHVARCKGWETLGGHLVAIHRRALDKVIANYEARFEPGGHRIDSDGIYNEFRRDADVETLICLPNMATQTPSPSGITDGSGLRHRILSTEWGRRLVAVPKRAALSAGRLVPTRLLVALWNRSAARRAGARKAEHDHAERDTGNETP